MVKRSLGSFTQIGGTGGRSVGNQFPSVTTLRPRGIHRAGTKLVTASGRTSCFLHSPDVMQGWRGGILILLHISALAVLSARALAEVDRVAVSCSLTLTATAWMLTLQPCFIKEIQVGIKHLPRRVRCPHAKSERQ